MGGKIFKDTSPVEQTLAPLAIKTIGDIITGIPLFPIGSAANPTKGKYSNDLDVMVDEQTVIEYFKAKDAKAARRALNDLIKSNGLDVAQTGVNVHVSVPVKNKKAQVDIMVVPDAEHVSKWHCHNIPENSPYKGVNKQVLLRVIARNQNMMWSPFRGLYHRDSAGERSDFITSDIAVGVKYIIGPNAVPSNLDCAETILASFPISYADVILTEAQQDKNWYVG
jgi:hypothetical protein